VNLMATDALLAQDIARRCKIAAAGEVLDATDNAEILRHITAERARLRALGVLWWDDADCPEECRAAFVGVVAGKVALEYMTEGEAQSVVVLAQESMMDLHRLRQQRSLGKRAQAEYF
jgi:hypothetical protein